MNLTVVLLGAVVPEPFFPILAKLGARFFEVIGALSVWHWMWENPLITVGALGAVAWMIFAPANK